METQDQLHFRVIGWMFQLVQFMPVCCHGYVVKMYTNVPSMHARIISHYIHNMVLTFSFFEA